MTLAQNTNTVGIQNNMESAHQNEITLISYAPDNDTRTIENSLQRSLESSLNSLTIHDHGMPQEPWIESVDSFASSSSAFASFRRRIDSVESFTSTSSAFSLVPRTFDPLDSSRNSASIFRKNNHSRCIVVHPQTTGRPIVELSFDPNNDEIPDHLLVPIL